MNDSRGDARDDVNVTRYEERAEVGTEQHESGRVRVSKHVETLPVEQTVSRSVEHADDSERVPALEGDSGEVETLEDGSVSIPVFEEVLVVTKKLVVRERVIVRKRTVIDEHTLQTELRREHVTIDADGVDLPDEHRDHIGDRDRATDDEHRTTEAVHRPTEGVFRPNEERHRPTEDLHRPPAP